MQWLVTDTYDVFILVIHKILSVQYDFVLSFSPWNLHIDVIYYFVLSLLQVQHNIFQVCIDSVTNRKLDTLFIKSATPIFIGNTVSVDD
jgi:hypothetical protein